MIRYLMLVSNLSFWDVCMFGDIHFDMDVKNGFFVSCLRQSAKGEMTALNMQ